MLRDAKIAVSLAKSQGKSNFVIFDENMRMTLANQVSLEADFRKAIEQNELRLHYQPIKSLETGQVTIIEALVRWQHPRRGMIYPNDFIHLAEESDWIIQIGEWVLREACRQTREWQDKYPLHHPLTVSVNISSKQLLQKGFITLVKAILEDTGLDAHHLKMEITESIFLGKSDEVIRVLTQLNETGVQLYIDDFGTGYSSLSYLSQIPFDAIKIDRSFVDGLISRDGDMKIVEAIVRLASDLGKDLVAEGVETVEQRDWLQKLGCKYEQGYLFSRPVEADAVEKFFHPEQV
jgi:EAL domain-containing protein (putative c-di-GMP-specific phosphodiesterase class I)